MQPEAPAQPLSFKSQVRTGQVSKTTPGPAGFITPSFKAFQMVFKELIYRILSKIKGETFFVWSSKLLGNPATRNKKLQCSYHRDKGHLTENCHKLKIHLEQLVSDGHLNDYIDSNLSSLKEGGMVSKRSGMSKTVPAGVIHVIHNPLCTSILLGSFRSDLQKAAHLRQSFRMSDSTHLALVFCSKSYNPFSWKVISFSDSDLRDVQLPHSDPLVITLRIGNFDVKRVLID